MLDYVLTPWRNGSASDSRSEGCVFKSRRGQLDFFFSRLMFFFRINLSLFVSFSIYRIICTITHGSRSIFHPADFKTVRHHYRSVLKCKLMCWLESREKNPPPVGLEPTTYELEVQHASPLRHGGG